MGGHDLKGVAMTGLTGKVALVTGASMGIGEGLAAMLATEGAKVVLAARRESELERVASEVRDRGGAGGPGGNRSGG
jgi:NADP-dependent 3-hydroxy acid dehydrogenase YdfG